MFAPFCPHGQLSKWHNRKDILVALMLRDRAHIVALKTQFSEKTVSTVSISLAEANKVQGKWYCCGIPETTAMILEKSMLVSVFVPPRKVASGATVRLRIIPLKLKWSQITRQKKKQPHKTGKISRSTEFLQALLFLFQGASLVLQTGEELQTS